MLQLVQPLQRVQVCRRRIFEDEHGLVMRHGIGFLKEELRIEALSPQKRPVLKQEGQAQGAIHAMHVPPHQVSAHRHGQQQVPSGLHHLREEMDGGEVSIWVDGVSVSG